MAYVWTQHIMQYTADMSGEVRASMRMRSMMPQMGARAQPSELSVRAMGFRLMVVRLSCQGDVGGPS